MAEDLVYWMKKLKGVDRDKILLWITKASGKGLSKPQIQEYMDDMYRLHTAQAAEIPILEQEFKEKWDGPADKDEESEPEQEEVTKPQFDDQETEEPEDPEEPDLEPDDEEQDEEEIIKEASADVQDVPEGEEPDAENFDDLETFDNPDLEDIEIGNEEVEEDDDIPSAEDILAMTKKYQKSPVGYSPTNEDFHVETITPQRYEEIMEPFRPYFALIESEPELLKKFAQQADIRNHPPYMQIRSILINNKIKDPNHVKILVNTYDESASDRPIQQTKTIMEAIDITRTLTYEARLQSALLNYDAIVEAMVKDRANLIALVYLLEIYAESKHTSPFEFHIPKERVTETIKDAFTGINDMIRNMVVEQLAAMRLELKGEMVDVSQVVERNMGRFDAQISDAIERVVWKVKTDVEETNLEDIKRAQLFVLNMRQSSYHLGAGAVAVMAIMLDDLMRRLLNENFKLDKIKEFRRYRNKEMSKQLGYKGVTVVNESIRVLARNKLAKLYPDGSFSLAK